MPKVYLKTYGCQMNERDSEQVAQMFIEGGYTLTPDETEADAILINTSRGALVDTAAAIEALKTGKIVSMGLDVYEEEGDLFFEDLSDKVIQDYVFSRLLTFPNVLITGHQVVEPTEAVVCRFGWLPVWSSGSATALGIHQ